jgi:endonuclease G, mitochondrial
MSTVQEQLAILRRYRAAVQAKDGKLAEESRDLGFETEAFTEAASPEAAEQQMVEESIVMRRERPVLAIRDNVTKLVFIDQADSEIWGVRLTKAKPFLDDAIRAVGRVNLSGGRLDWVGTAWLVAENVVVTNRHVAQEFAARRGEGFTFRVGLGGQMSADIDFLQEIDNPTQLIFKLVKPLYIEEAPGPDVAFFEIEMVSGDVKLAKTINLATQVGETENVASIGYPAYDSRIPEPDLMERIYGKTYNKKRLAPGGVTRVESTHVVHNCTTLGGNSGSVVLDLDRGEALGLHFSGSFLKANYAVRADVVKKLLADVHSGRLPRRNEATTPMQASAPATQALGRAGIALPKQGRRKASLTLPLTLNISIDIDDRSVVPQRVWRPDAAAPSADDSDFISDTEAVAADYRDRVGYDPAFLGKKNTVDLPTAVRDSGDILDFEVDGASETVLRYEHFSVIMSRSRRICFLSACNIDGNQSRKSARVAWKWDPRIPKSQQIMKECYGNPPKFSRGHMTRREDPGWGDEATAIRGNADSMHVTNTTPQMQAFNSPIWLALEDYALEHARQDAMLISVFTGPYLTEADPVMYGVQIPVRFWKIIAFIHDETGKLSATGYEMSQKKSLPSGEDEFVFGQYNSPQLGTTTQVPIASIQQRSGIDFGTLLEHDPLNGGEEGIAAEGAAPVLMSMEEIRFLS